jgi:hypothetical protein
VEVGTKFNRFPFFNEDDRKFVVSVFKELMENVEKKKNFKYDLLLLLKQAAFAISNNPNKFTPNYFVLLFIIGLIFQLLLFFYLKFLLRLHMSFLKYIYPLILCYPQCFQEIQIHLPLEILMQLRDIF